MPNFTCDLNTLMVNSACFQDKCLSQYDRDALDIYFKIKGLAAAGGTDYSNNLAQLMIDAAGWMRRANDELKAIDLWIDMENAIDNGASINTNINALALAAKCLKAGCLGKEQLHGLSSFLKCAINSLGKPD